MSYPRSVTLGGVLAVMMLGIATSPYAQGLTTEGPGYVESRMIVKLEDGVEVSDLAPVNRAGDGETVDVLPEADIGVVELDDGVSVPEAVREYEKSPLVEYAEPDYVLKAAQTTTRPNDPRFGEQYGLANTGQKTDRVTGTVGADINALTAWQTTTGDPDTVVAVIDGGVDIRHPDLNDNIWVNTDEIPNNNVDDDRNGYTDDRNGYDFANNDAGVFDGPDGDVHGTHIAGTIGAEGNNGIGVTGVNQRVKVMPLKFIGPSGGSVSKAIRAIDYAVANGARVSNLSWGGGPKSQALEEAIGRATASGHLFVAAAGNGGSDFVGDDVARRPFYPAAYANPNIISVAATDNRDRLAPFSNYGSAGVDLAAPGVSILSTYPGGKYRPSSGTSMAAPYVTGAAALLLGSEPDLTAAEVKDRILGMVDARASLRGKTVSGGRLDVAQVLSGTVTDDTGPPEGPVGAVTISRVRPTGGATTGQRRPTVSARVGGDRASVTKSDISVKLDGKRVPKFSYTARSGLISFRPALATGRHSVMVSVKRAGGDAAQKSWSFRVVKR